MKKIPLLSVRPMLLAYIPDLLESGAKIEYAFQIYEVLVEKWLERESTWVPSEALRQFSERLAINLYINRERRGAERILRAELAVLATEWNISLEDWQLTGRSLLNRDAEGNYKFAHRSIMEYLVVKKLIDGDMTCDGVALSDQMKAFAGEMILQHLVEKKPVSRWTRPFIWEFIKSSVKLKRPIPFDAIICDLSEFQLQLRSKPISNLKDEKTQTMLMTHNFFDSLQNKEGKGVSHLYELRRKSVSYWNKAGIEILGSPDVIVFDYATGLIWQQSGSSNSMIYTDAAKYIRELNDQRFAGYNNWRLPTLDEAMSLMESKQYDSLYFDSVFDHNQNRIWTADQESVGRAWYVDFVNGLCHRHDVDVGYHVRAVCS